MLPNGTLAKHGYTTKWGFFSGICAGSGSKPFETHTDLIQKFIEGAELKLANNLEFIAKLQAPPTVAKGWVRCYRSAKTRYETSGYHWHEVEFALHQGKYDTRPRVSYANPYKEGEWLNCYTHGLYVDYTVAHDDVLAYVAAANEKKAQAVAKENEEIQRYIDWQRGRVANWKEEPLLPR